MSKDKKSILGKLFGGSGGCNCGVEIVEEKDEKKLKDKKNKEK
ncbi:hypothetical protein [Anaeromicrobium sediminis]|nr:hypothetical protein [Anaeromicrobium sediminis]